MARHFWTATIQEVAAYFHGDASTFSRQIGQLDAVVMGRAGAMSQLKKYTRALTQACLQLYTHSGTSPKTSS